MDTRILYNHTCIVLIIQENRPVNSYYIRTTHTHTHIYIYTYMQIVFLSLCKAKQLPRIFFKAASRLCRRLLQQARWTGSGALRRRTHPLPRVLPLGSNVTGPHGSVAPKGFTAIGNGQVNTRNWSAHLFGIFRPAIFGYMMLHVLHTGTMWSEMTCSTSRSNGFSHNVPTDRNSTELSPQNWGHSKNPMVLALLNSYIYIYIEAEDIEIFSYPHFRKKSWETSWIRWFFRWCLHVVIMIFRMNHGPEMVPMRGALRGDGIYADSQEKPSAARARRERRKRQGTVQTPIVPDIVEDVKGMGMGGMGGMGGGMVICSKDLSGFFERLERE